MNKRRKSNSVVYTTNLYAQSMPEPVSANMKKGCGQRVKQSVQPTEPSPWECWSPGALAESLSRLAFCKGSCLSQNGIPPLGKHTTSDPSNRELKRIDTLLQGKMTPKATQLIVQPLFCPVVFCSHSQVVSLGLLPNRHTVNSLPRVYFQET